MKILLILGSVVLLVVSAFLLFKWDSGTNANTVASFTLDLAAFALIVYEMQPESVVVRLTIGIVLPISIMVAKFVFYVWYEKRKSIKEKERKRKIREVKQI